MNFECISNYQQFNYDLYYITNQSLDLSTEQFKIYLDENINKVLKIDLINKKINRKNISGSESNSFVCYTSLIILFEYMNHWWKLQLANIDSTLKYSTRNRMDELFVYCFKTYILNQGNKEKLLLSLLKNLGGSSASAQSNNNPGNGNQKHLSKTQENDIAKLLSATVSCLSYVLYLEELCNSSSNASKVLVAYCVTECNWNSEANAVSNTEAAVIMGGNILNGNNVSQLIRLCLSKSIYPTGDAKRTYESQKNILSNSTSSMQALSVEVLSCRLGLSTLLSHPAMIDKSNPVSEIATKECIHVFVRKWTRRLHDMAIGVYRNRNNPVHNSNDGGNMYEYVPTFRQATDGDLQCLKNEQRSCCGAGSSVQLLPILDQHSSLVLNQSIQNTIVNVFNVLLDLIESNDMFTEEVVVEICKFQSIHTQPVSKEDTFDMHLDYLSVLGLYMLGYCGNNKAEENVQVKQEHAIKRCTNSVGDAKENWIMYGSMEVSLSSSKVVGYLLTNGLVSKSKLARKAWYQVTVENVCNVVNQIRKTSGEGGRGVEDLNEHILSDITNKHLTAHGANPAKYNTNPKKNLVRDGDAQNMLYEHCLAIYLPLLGELFNQLVPHPDSTGCSRNTEDCDSTHIYGLCSFSKALFTILRYMLCRRGNSHSNQNISNRLIAICLYLLARLNNCQISEGRENENLSDFEDALTPWATHGKARTAPLFEYDKYKEEQEHNDQPVDMSYVNNVHADNTHCIMTCNVQSTPMDLRNAGSGSVLHLHLKEHARGMRALVALHQKDIQDILELKPWNDPVPYVLKSQYGFGNEVFKHPHSMTEDLEQYLSELMESRARINYEEDMCGVVTLKSNVDGSADCNQSIAHTNTMSNIESDPDAQMISNHCNSPGLSLIGRVSESMLYPTTPYSMSQALDQPAETFGCSGMVSTKQSPSSSMTPNGKSSMHPSLIAPFQLPEECDEPAAVLSPLVISNKEIKPDIVEEEMLCGDDETTFYDATRGRSSLQRATEEMTSASISIEVPVEMPPNRDTLARMEGDGLEENVEQNMVITDPSPAPLIPHSVPCEDNLEILDINKSLYAQLAKSQQQCEELKLQNTTLKFEACNDQKRIALLENENRILHEKISDGQNERIAYEIRNKDMHSKIDGLEKLLQDTYGKLQVLAKDEANRLSEYSILKEQLALKNTLLIKTQSELSTLETRNCSNNATITEMNTFFQQLLQEKNQAYNEKLEIKRQVDGVLIENNYFKQQIASYMDECKNVKLHVMELKSHISCLEEKNKVLHYDLDRNQQKISDLQNVNDDLNSALKQHVLKIKELELSAVESRGNIEMLESEKEQLQCTIVESNDKLDELRDQSDSLLEKLHEKNEECSRLSLALSNSQEELKKHQDLMNLINKISKNKDIESILSK